MQRMSHQLNISMHTFEALRHCAIYSTYIASASTKKTVFGLGMNRDVARDVTTVTCMICA